MPMRLRDAYLLVLLFISSYLILALYGLFLYAGCCGVLTPQVIVSVLQRLDAPLVEGRSVLFILHYVVGLHIMLRGEELINGYFWELFTSLFIHANIYHLLFNCLALLMVDSMTSTINGRREIVYVFVVGGLASNLGAALLAPDTTSVGSSGGIFAAFAWTALINYLNRGDRVPITLLVVIFAISSIPIIGTPNTLAHALGVFTGSVLALFNKPGSSHK